MTRSSIYRAVALGAAVSIITAVPSVGQETARMTGKVESLDPAFDKLVPEDAQVELLGEGYEWSEGPLWIAEGDFLIFSDVLRNHVLKWKEGEGVTEYLMPSGYTSKVERGGEMGSNGLALDNEGRLLLCQHGDRCIGRMNAPVLEPKPVFTQLARKYEGKLFNSPNDLVVHSSDAIYFTDPPYGMPQRDNDPNRELDFCGVYRLVPGEAPVLVIDDMTRPNGIALSPDEKILYVAQSDPQAPVIRAYDVQADGSVTNGRTFFDGADLAAKRRGAFDGLKLDVNGNLFATGPGGVLIITPEGKHLGTIMTGQPVANCAFGDDGSTLYMTSDMFLCRIKTTTVGDGF